MKDFSNLNHLPTDIKQLIVIGQTLVQDVKDKMRDRDYTFDLTSKMQLKSDCREVEKYIKLIGNGKINEKNTKRLESAILRLRTDFDGIVRFFTR